MRKNCCACAAPLPARASAATVKPAARCLVKMNLIANSCKLWSKVADATTVRRDFAWGKPSGAQAGAVPRSRAAAADSILNGPGRAAIDQDHRDQAHESREAGHEGE